MSSISSIIPEIVKIYVEVNSKAELPKEVSNINIADRCDKRTLEEFNSFCDSVQAALSNIGGFIQVKEKKIENCFVKTINFLSTGDNPKGLIVSIYLFDKYEFSEDEFINLDVLKDRNDKYELVNIEFSPSNFEDKLKSMA